MSTPDELNDAPPPVPAPPELIAQGATLVRQHPECFWFRHPEARIQNLEDLRLVVHHLREYGDHRAWWAAQDLHRCLSPLSKKAYKPSWRATAARKAISPSELC